MPKMVTKFEKKNKGMNLGWKGCTKRKNLWKKTHGLINLIVDEGNNPFKVGGVVRAPHV